MKTTACLILLLLSFTTNAQQPGTLDKSFGDTGIAIDTRIKGTLNVIVLQSNGKIIGGGSGGFNDVLPFKLARYNEDGSIDDSFGKNGFTGANELSEVVGIAVQKDDAIVALSHTASDIKLARYRSDGGLDSSFGYSGTVLTNVGKTDAPTDILVQPDGKIVVGGYIINAENQDRQGFLIRYLPDGSLDQSFGKEGISVFSAIGEEEDLGLVSGIALQPDGKIVAAVGTDIYDVYRFNRDGSLDKSFGNGGGARFGGASANISYMEVKRIVVQPDGKIVGGGSGYGGAQRIYMAVARLNADGSIDKGFGQSRLQYVQFGTDQSEGYAVLLQNDGKIVVSGWEHPFYYDYGRFALARLNEDGSLDSTFGSNAKTITATTGFAVSKSAVLQKDGKIVLGGDTYIGGNFDGHSYNLLARYNSYDPAKQHLAIRIRRWLQHHGISWQYNPNVRYYSVQRSVDGGITYKEVASVSNKTNSYEDAAAQTTANALYRLEAIAKDGSRTYSNMVLIDDAQSARFFPNPVKDNLQLQGLPSTGKTNLSVMDLNGNVRSSATATGTNYSVSTANLSSGSYLLKIQHNGTTVTQPFVKE